ncbi:MAG: DUF308 domain-containing protein [Blautia sp.]|nr:DUF308 domain-containing protein [Blautia sp.]
MKEHKIQKKIINFLKGEIAAAVFFILVGLCLVIFPVQTVDVICRIVFGILLVFAGLYNIGMYLSVRYQTTVFNMFAGVIVLVLGWFMFENPQIVVKLMPRLLGALLCVDSIWMIRTALKFKKAEISIWNMFLLAGLTGIILGIVTIINPFGKVRSTILFAGIVFLLKGAADVAFDILRKKNLPPEAAAQSCPSGTEGPVVMPGIVPGTDMVAAPQQQPYGDVFQQPPYEEYPSPSPSQEKSGHERKGLFHGFGNHVEEERHFGDAAVHDADTFQQEQAKENEVLEEWKD